MSFLQKKKLNANYYYNQEKLFITALIFIIKMQKRIDKNY